MKQEQEEMAIQVDISGDFLHRIARIYKFKYDMTNLPIQNITEEDVLEFLDKVLSFIDGRALVRSKDQSVLHSKSCSP
jgi:hypothetical protein